MRARRTAPSRRSWSPRATANSQPIAGLRPWYAPSRTSADQVPRSFTSRESGRGAPPPAPPRCDGEGRRIASSPLARAQGEGGRGRGSQASREAVRVRGRVAAFEADLVRPLALELHEEVRVDGQAAAGRRVKLRRPALDTLGVEDRVPGAVERVGQVDPAAVAADLDHLGSAVQGTVLRVGALRDDAAQPHRAGQLRLEWVGDVVLLELAGAPA